MAIFAYSGTGAPFSVAVDAWDNTTKIATFSPAVTTAADSTTKYVVIALPAASTTNPIPANVVQYNGDDCPTADSAGYPKVTVLNDTSAGAIKATNGVVWARGNLGATIVSEILDALRNNYTTADTVGEAISLLLTYLGTPSSSNLSALVEAIEAQTTKLTFTSDAYVKADVTHISGEEVAGSGTDGDPWKALGT